jgi:phosphoribosyl 1,2-cyclic phosphate phosphodiesterase
MRVTILGCGGSAGVPMLGGRAGGYWGACDPANPRNRRRRVSILVEDAGQVILVDTSPDLRAQLLDAGATRIDAVLYTHDHADHLNGIDELRHIRVKGRTAIDCFGEAAVMAAIERRFRYAFRQNEEGSGVLYKPFLKRHDLAGPFKIAGVPVTPFVQDHGFGSTTTGYRIGDVAYSTDVVDLPEASWAALQGIRLWVVDALREEPHPTHAHLERTLSWIAQLKPERAVLTHMNHSMDYEAVARRCPPGVEPGYDGLVLEL